MIPGLERSPGEGKGYSLQYSGLENSMDCIVHGVTKSWIRLSDFHFTHCLKSASLLYILKLEPVMPPALIFFLSIALAILSLLCSI